MMGSLHQIVSGWAPTPWRAGACASSSLSTSPAAFPRAAGAFLQPLSGGEADLSALTPREATNGLKARRQPHPPSAAQMRKPPVARRQAGSGMLGAPGRPLDLKPSRSILMPGCRGSWDGRPPEAATPPAASSGLLPGPRDSAQASCRGAASTLAGSQPVAVDAAPQWCSDGRGADCHGYDRRPSHAGRVRFVRHGAGSAAPRGRSIAGKDNGLCPEIPACSTVQTQLAGAARPGPFPGRA